MAATTSSPVFHVSAWLAELTVLCPLELERWSAAKAEYKRLRGECSAVPGSVNRLHQAWKRLSDAWSACRAELRAAQYRVAA